MEEDSSIPIDAVLTDDTDTENIDYDNYKGIYFEEEAEKYQ
jgi:hypothetical protein